MPEARPIVTGSPPGAIVTLTTGFPPGPTRRHEPSDESGRLTAPAEAGRRLLAVPSAVSPGAGENVVSIRGDYVRLVHLGSIFGVDDAITDPASGLVVLVDTEDRGRIGLVIDELLGQQQVVIKSLEENYDQIEGISAATILGNGRVALILDVDGLARMRPLAGNPVLASGGAVREQAAA